GISLVLAQRATRLSLPAGADAVYYLHAPHGPDAARGALAARLVGAELHGEASLRRHVDGVVEHHHAAVADQPALRRERLVVEGRVEQRFGEVRPQRAAHLHGADRAAAVGAAAEIRDALPERQPERPPAQPRR